MWLIDYNHVVQLYLHCYRWRWLGVRLFSITFTTHHYPRAGWFTISFQTWRLPDMMAILAQNSNIRYAGVFFMAAGLYAVGPCYLCLIPNNVSGLTKRATSTALTIMVCSIFWSWHPVSEFITLSASGWYSLRGLNYLGPYRSSTARDS